MTTFITGDRSMSPIYPGQVALEIIRTLRAGDEIATGENSGVEQIVRMICDETEVPYLLIPNPADLVDGKVNWDARHYTVNSESSHVVAIHSDPLASSIIRSLISIILESELTLRTPADLIA